ncbi:MAG TPA: LPS export ABC transporter permease LptG [Ignavibacteriales bacterium]|nr:LPS export ABC transporter permease LptG [Ignavibacteriales bacterium]
MKIIDRYFTKQFLQTLLFALAAFTLIFVIIDMMENLDDFLDQNVSYPVIFEYYVYFAPDIIRLMIPVATLLACLFTVGRMANQNELTAIKSSGVSLYRIMSPFVVTSLIISLFSVYFGGYVVPQANKAKVTIEQVYMKKELSQAGTNIFFQDTRNRIVDIYFFDTQHSRANQVSIQEFDPKDLTHMTSRLDAVQMQYDSTKKVWVAFNGTKRTFLPEGENVQTFSQMNLPGLHFTPRDVLTKQQKPEEMTLSQLSDFYRNQARTGNDPTRTLIEYHSRFSFAFASVVVIFLGLPLASQKKRGGLALQFGLSLLFTFLYLGFMKISEAFGKNGVLDPVMTAWLANIIFLGAAIINLYRTQK